MSYILGMMYNKEKVSMGSRGGQLIYINLKEALEINCLSEYQFHVKWK